MKKFINHHSGTVVLVLITLLASCRAPEVALKQADKNVPASFKDQTLPDSISVAEINWRTYFEDPGLIGLIDTALQNNQELNIVLQELVVSQNEVLERSGEYLPSVNLGAGIGAEKPGRFTRDGTVEHSLEIEEGREFPEPLGDFQFGAMASWEVDIWRKLRNAKDAAQLRYLAANEGRNFLVSNLIAEIAESYYELMALDNLLQIINNNAGIQEEALRKVIIQKENAKANQLVVNRFEAQLLNTRNLQYAIRQQIVETENRINFLVGRYPTTIQRNAAGFMDLQIDSMQAGIPARMLQNRPDIRQAEYQLQAANMDVLVARADFYPSLDIAAGVGFQAFNPSFLLKPESILFNLAGELTAPLINKKGIRARYNMASATQVQTVYQYEQTVLNAYTDVLNQLTKLENYANSLVTKQQEVDILSESVNIANSLFRYAKADYVEVLLTQEEVLDAKMELVETKLQQLQAKVGIYRALGGGWR
ncbi:TolC family protein [Flavilitoribacter nigricans]|uniref:RND transporter n=1 Tax=Flavilitoribacter nigricans (strain ATCC 23147 / DSM 23189 / NBRC 102662 / NCIMB 1420 / SS-2) TaxID=1122177 RepID=A0A2D0NFG4_FLAN2|nr:TolC family protein [Flavilitoribacter nigricans]PHN06909.1 RND transporter [Flavilitoribacter nigricans DSM 23189 = NBRC 102662]